MCVRPVINENIRFIVVDSFCGFGGVTHGMLNARDQFGNEILKVVACINHDSNAIASHSANYDDPDCKHYVEDVRNLKISPLIKHIKRMKKKYPNALLIFWSSLECTNHSNAKGGKPRDADSRSLAEDMHRYYEALDPDYIMIENVREFMAWGDLDKKGKPISRDKGRLFLKWVKDVQTKNRSTDHYYDYDFKLLNAADYGAHTRRIRYFAIFAKKGLPISWPKQTHAKNGGDGSLFQMYKPWNPVREVLDFSDKGKSIFNRTTKTGKPKDLVERTLERIYAGLVKFVAQGDKEWLMKYRNYLSGGVNPGSGLDVPAPTICTQFNPKVCMVEKIDTWLLRRNNAGTGKPNKGNSIDVPAPTICTGFNPEIVKTEYLTNYYSSGGQLASIDKVGPTVTTRDRIAKIAPVWLDKAYGSNPHNHSSIHEPAGAVVSNDKHSLVTPAFIEKAYSGDPDSKVKSLDEPLGAITTKDHHRPVFIQNYYSSGGQHTDINSPNGTVMPIPKERLVQVIPFMMPTAYKNKPRSIDEPMHTLTADRHHDYLINPQWGTNQNQSLDTPSFTLIARMDKAPPYIVQTEEGLAAILIYEDDSPMTKKIKLFMAAYGIVDIKMRMLKIPELLQIQGLPANYKYVGTSTEAKKFVGNSVCPVIPQNMIQEIDGRLLSENIRIAAA